jgi:hypothetical protein
MVQDTINITREANPLLKFQFGNQQPFPRVKLFGFNEFLRLLLAWRCYWEIPPCSRQGNSRVPLFCEDCRGAVSRECTPGDVPRRREIFVACDRYFSIAQSWDKYRSAGTVAGNPAIFVSCNCLVCGGLTYFRGLLAKLLDAILPYIWIT